MSAELIDSAPEHARPRSTGFPPARRPLVAAVAGHREHDRVLAVMARFIGVGFLAYLLISVPILTHPEGMTAGWFPPAAAVLAFAPGAVLLVITFTPYARRGIPIAAVACAVGYLLAVGLWFVAWTGERSDVELVSWLINFSGLAAMAIALVRPGREAVVVLILAGFGAQLIGQLGRVDDLKRAHLLIETLFSISFSLPFVLAVTMVVRTGAILDATRADAIAAAGRAAASAARNSERSRFDALIHDHVIAVLVAAKSHLSDPRVPEQARAALDELAAATVDAEPDETRQVPHHEAVDRLRAVVTTIDPDTPVAGRIDPSAAHAEYPMSALHALSEALGEALRNSVLHAGPDVGRAVLLEAADGMLRVTVVDDGFGFEPAAVPPERLGMQVSIQGRMAALPGGSATVHSRPRRGTTVQLTWERP